MLERENQLVSHGASDEAVERLDAVGIEDRSLEVRVDGGDDELDFCTC